MRLLTKRLDTYGMSQSRHYPNAVHNQSPRQLKQSVITSLDTGQDERNALSIVIVVGRKRSVVPIELAFSSRGNQMIWISEA